MSNLETSVKEKSIVFIGFMGVGKTTIGSLVAKKLYRTFVDIDEEIEKQHNMSISEIFALHGEKAFREMEKDTIRSFCEQPLKVISLGGGAFMNPEVREICLKNCIVFYLDMSWEQWKERLNILIDNRPVLQGKNIDEIEELFYKRQSAYSVNHSTYKVDSQTAEEAADYIVDSLKLAWDLYK
ncbi:Shikimate kinase I [Bacillus thermotolerans]|uniref:Shikimate kinase n=2 Tax=Bacillus thermotolerans TaxID=1221996 RepID=A0A0F5I7S1_BACTR|nr:Shikimate kinase I [Bacillus thermotolerans]KKB41222.1 Shikimate kinase I [Bacillus thermotolerans]KKB44085.1 Shikimate kinase I [Bacillus thermotolerans]